MEQQKTSKTGRYSVFSPLVPVLRMFVMLSGVKNGHEPAPSPRLKKRNHSSSIISADADCASDQTKASRYKTWPFLPRGGSGAVSSKAEAIRHFLESLDLKANSGDTKPALSKKESRGLEIR